MRNRAYFKAIYFRTEDGILFEIATKRPAFSTDEPLEKMNEALCLPDHHQHLRAQLEKKSSSFIIKASKVQPDRAVCGHRRTF